MASSRPSSSLPSSVRKSATTPSVSSRGQLPPRAPNSSQARPSPHHHNNHGVYTPRQLGLTRYSPGRAARLQQQLGVLPTIADNEQDPPESQVEESQELLTPPAAASTVHRCDNFDSQISGITMDHALQGAEDYNPHADEEDENIDYGRGGGFNEEEEEEEEVAPLNDYSASTYSLNQRLAHFMGCHITTKNRIAAEYVFMFQAYSYNKSLGPAKRSDQNDRMLEQYKELIAMIPRDQFADDKLRSDMIKGFHGSKSKAKNAVDGMSPGGFFKKIGTVVPNIQARAGKMSDMVGKPLSELASGTGLTDAIKKHKVKMWKDKHKEVSTLK